jgi:hypothetical protein
LRPFSVHQSRRAVRRRCQLHGPSRFDVSPAWAPTLRPVRPCGFSLPRVSFPFFACVETPPARVIRGRCLSPTYRARDPGCYRDLAGRLTARRRSWDLSFPSQCSSDLRAVTPHRHDRAHLPFPRIHPPRVSSSREPTLVERGSWVMRPRLLGFACAPSSQPCRVIRRPRHGFYAQGRSYSPARTALGFQCPLSGLRRRASGLHF